MGCDVYDGVLEASSPAEAIEAYKGQAPIGYYDDKAYSILDVQFFEEEEFDSRESAVRFLETRMKKWDLKVGMVKCGQSVYAYYVLLPC